ncbi:MAG: hypothetical protein ACRD5D_00005, partial [Candidatus Polarisedimenticolia bacterium]
MFFRCANCRAKTQVQIPANLAAPLTAACSGCGRRYRFEVSRPRGATDAERYRKARSFAETHRIDLSSAYSVLEGVMGLEEALALRKGGAEKPSDPEAAAARPPSAPEPATRRSGTAGDPAGASAVEEALREALAAADAEGTGTRD